MRSHLIIMIEGVVLKLRGRPGNEEPFDHYDRGRGSLAIRDIGRGRATLLPLFGLPLPSQSGNSKT